MGRKWRNRKLFIYRKKTFITPPGYVIFQIWLQIRNGREMLDGGKGAVQFEGPKRVFLMKISKKLN